MKALVTSGDHDKISKVIHVLIKDFAKSPQANHRKVSKILLPFLLLSEGLILFYRVDLLA